MLSHQHRRSLPLGLALLAALGAQPVAAESGEWLKESPHFQPFRAEPRAAQINITALAVSDEFPFQIEPGRRQVWDISLGKEIPIYSHTRGAGDIDLGEGESWWGVFIPVGFHMIEDFKDPSAPILNTDYRFGLSVKFLRGLGDGWSWGLKLQPFGHQSSHLGDEFSLAGRRRHRDFERINVSYEFWDLALLAERQGDRHFLRAQLGVVELWGSRGFYTFDLSETGGRQVTPSKESLEPYLGLERLYPEAQGWDWFMSADLRHRIVFDYHRASPQASEHRQLSVNLMVGLMKARGTRERGVTDFYLRFYRGVNPHGQFRSQRDYALIGIGLHVDI